MATAIILGLLAFAGILLAAIGLATSRSGSGISARLERYAAGGRAEATATATAATGPGLGDVLAQRVTLPFNRLVEQRDFGANLSRELARADLRLKVSEYLAIWAGCIVAVPVVMFVLGYIWPALQSPISLVVGAILGLIGPRFWLNRRKSSRLNAFNKQLPDTITLIANALRAGSSFLQAVEMVTREAQPPISTEFTRVVREVNLGLAVDTALENMVRRVRSDDLELMATAITIQHQVGGNLAEILDSIAFTIRERVRIKGEIRTLTAQQRLSGYVVAGLPIGMLAFLYVIAPGFLAPMFQNPPGVMGLPAGSLVLAFGAFMMFVGFMLIRKIVDIEV